MYENILVPTDGSSDARRGAEHGVELAKVHGATVHALYVIEDQTNPWTRASLDDQLAEAEAYGDEVTGDVAALAAEAGVDCVTESVVGARISERILDYAEEEDIDVIVMGSGFRGRMGDVLGSTADKVVRTAQIPVTVLKGS